MYIRTYQAIPHMQCTYAHRTAICHAPLYTPLHPSTPLYTPLHALRTPHSPHPPHPPHPPHSFSHSATLHTYTHSGVSVVKTQFSPLIFKLYMTGMVLGTLYSVPPIQLKRIPICAGTIIAFVRGFLLNFGVYYAVREALGVSFQVKACPKYCLLIIISYYIYVFLSFIIS
jgi:hypothetical protein